MENSVHNVSTYIGYIDMLPGVLNSNVVMDGGEIREVHVLSDFSRSPKQLVRDIQSLFMAKFSLDIDHKVISIAQADVSLPSKCADRLAIEEVSLTKRRGGTEFTISLSYRGSKYVGASSCTNDSSDYARAIAQATLDAVCQAQGSKMCFSVLDTRFCELAGQRSIIICVSARTPSGVSGRYIGSAFIYDDDTETAIVRATLCAVNRKVFNG